MVREKWSQKGHNNGKKDTRKYFKGKQGKTDEIRKALTHRARLRKNYFKLLEKEGMDVPNRDGDVEKDETKSEENESEDENPDQSTKTSEVDTIKEKVKNREALSFQERMLLKKDRRQKDKDRKMQKTREKLETMRSKELLRQRQTERIQNTKTRKGQPLMGPRINSLLEKIQQSKNQ